jgi:hypothetical protein
MERVREQFRETRFAGDQSGLLTCYGLPRQLVRRKVVFDLGR